MSRLEYAHPQPFPCRCGAKHLMKGIREIPEEGDGWWGEVRHHREFFDWYAPNRVIEKCNSCGANLAQVWGAQPKPRDVVIADGRRVL
jgi:hypothetical protein